MKISKTTINATREALKKYLKINESALEELELSIVQGATAIASNDSLQIVQLKKKFCLDLMEKFDIKLYDDSSLENVVDGLSVVYNELKKFFDKVKGVIASISKDGYTLPTLSLPVSCFTCFKCNADYICLLLSGIEVNARCKSEDDLGSDEMEKALWEYEKQLAAMIRTDYSIDMELWSDFLKVMIEYLSKYYNAGFSMHAQKSDYDKTIKLFVETFVAYVVFQETEHELTKEELRFLHEEIDDYLKCGDEYYKFVPKICEQKIVALRGTLQKKSTKTITYNNPRLRLEDYVQGGQIVALCERSKFGELLSRSFLSRADKNRYISLMDSALSYYEERSYKEFMKAYRDAIMKKEERDAYEKAVSNLGDCSLEKAQAVERVDEAVEMLVDEVVPLVERAAETLGIERVSFLNDPKIYEEAKEAHLPCVLDMEAAAQLAREYMKEAFDVLLNRSFECRERMVFYKIACRDFEGSKTNVPLFLTGLSFVDKRCQSLLKANLLDIIEGSRTGDKVLKKGLPCPIYLKGCDYKIAYVLVEGALIIVDCLESDGSEYDRIITLAKSEEFKKFLEDVRSQKEATFEDGENMRTIMDELNNNKRLSLR